MQIIPIASGKGGVGKSLLAANLAIALGQANKTVIVVDLDLGASNLHLVLGQQANSQGIGTFLTGASKFEDIIIKTDYPNVSLIPGDSEIPGFSALKIYQKKNLVKHLQSLNCDYIILDLGAGSHLGILDFFLLSSRGILITAPTVTSTLDAYLFLKNILFRLLSLSFKKNTPGFKYLESLKTDTGSMQKLYIPKIVEYLKTVDPENTEAFLNTINSFKPRLIMNMVDSPDDANKILKLRRSAQEYLNVTVEHLGVIYKDVLQDTALASRLPIIVYKPKSVLSQAIYRIAERILQSEEEDFNNYEAYEEYAEETFQSAEIDAQCDEKARMQYLEKLMGSEIVSIGELSEIVKSQQYEVASLKKENMLLKQKLKKAIKNGFSL